MRSFIKKLRKSPAAMAMLAFALIILIQIPFVGSDPYDLTDDLIWGPPGETRKSALVKLEGRDETLLEFVNELKNASASSTAPSTPGEGQFWFDTSTNEMKQYYASTWDTLWSFADTTTPVWEGNFDGDTIDANSGAIDNLEANTISAPYATLTDIDVVSARIGSATIGTLTALVVDQDSLVVNTLIAGNIDVLGYMINHAEFFDSFAADTLDFWPIDVKFNADGSKMYILGEEEERVYEYDLSVSWKPSSASFSTSFDVTAQDTFPDAFVFSNDGDKMYMVGHTNDKIFEYTLSIAWDVSSATFNTAIPSTDNNARGMVFNNDGTILYVCRDLAGDIRQFNLSTAWALSTAVAGNTLNVSTEDAAPMGVALNKDGTKMFVVGGTNRRVYQYELLTAWAVTPANYSNISYYIREGSADGFTFSKDGEYMYLSASKDINQYITNFLRRTMQP